MYTGLSPSFGEMSHSPKPTSSAQAELTTEAQRHSEDKKQKWIPVFLTILTLSFSLLFFSVPLCLCG
jgi:hypothetical protein